ncbi:hypothetical protein DRQ32_02275 [bacterium]|nr:MAG: hypothetical protein DRQ32_02275 [bacterium]
MAIQSVYRGTPKPTKPMLRTTTSILLIAFILLLPLLCTGGWLEHLCDCDQTGDCENELDCSSDPCEVGLIKGDPTAPARDKAMIAVVTLPVADLARAKFYGAQFSHDESTETHCMPYPESDLPLLI